VKREGRPLFEFDAKMVADVRVIDEPGVDAIVIEFKERCWLRMQLRPTFESTQQFDSRY
jgi:hypothetical protein